MATLRERVDAELENIDASVLHLPKVDRLPSLSELELAGAYMLDVEPERMEPLVRDLPCILSTLKEDLKKLA